MSGKMGKRATGKKPMTARRQSAKTDGAFGKETGGQVTTSETGRNLDRGSRKVRSGETASGD